SRRGRNEPRGMIRGDFAPPLAAHGRVRRKRARPPAGEDMGRRPFYDYCRRAVGLGHTNDRFGARGCGIRMAGLHVVLGATGGAGSAVVRELVARGFPARALGRKDVQFPDGVDYVRGDATDRSTLRRVCKGAAVVYHCVNVPYAQWEQTLPQLAREILEACAEAGARLVVMDNLYMYGPAEGPITEETPRRAVGPKGRLRAQLEETFLNAHRERKVDVCIARASDFYGPPSAGSKGNNVAAQLVFEPAMAGKPATWLGSL